MRSGRLDLPVEDACLAGKIRRFDFTDYRE